MPYLGKNEHIHTMHDALRRGDEIGNLLVQFPEREPAKRAVPSTTMDHLSLDNRSARGANGNGMTPTQAGTAEAPDRVIRQQLARILQSSTFIHSDKLSRFLRFVVEHVLNGNQGCLKEYVIGAEVYDRKPPYHPSLDSIVRTEARRLRGKLKEYYEDEGKEDPVYIYLRPGRYIPVFQSREELIGAESRTEPELLLSEIAPSITVSVFPFKDTSGNMVSSSYARGITDELAYALMLADGCTVVSPSTMAGLCFQEQSLVGAMDRVQAQMAYEGSVRADGTHLRVTARIVDASGLQLWVKRIDVEVDSETSFAIEEQIAVVLSAGFSTLFDPSRSPSVLPGT